MSFHIYQAFAAVPLSAMWFTYTTALLHIPSTMGLWLAFPQQKGEQDGETKWFDQMFLTKPEAEHVRRLVIADLQAQGHLEAPAMGNGGSGQQRPTHRTPEGEDVSQYYSNPADDDGDIPL